MAAPTQYTVGPLAGSKRWAVRANGRRISRHNKKRTAMDKARSVAERGDVITVQGKDGDFQKRIRVR